MHGAVTDQSLGHVPGAAKTDDVDEWIARLNAFYAGSLQSFLEDDPLSEAPRWLQLVAYQAPVPGTRVNQASVVYGRPSDDRGNPVLPSRAARQKLLGAGVHRLVVTGPTRSRSCS